MHDVVGLGILDSRTAAQFLQGCLNRPAHFQEVDLGTADDLGHLLVGHGIGLGLDLRSLDNGGIAPQLHQHLAGNEIDGVGRPRDQQECANDGAQIVRSRQHKSSEPVAYRPAKIHVIWLRSWDGQ